ncbi:adenine phosphoribosyltransferase [Brettanomyces nanus]|uniref:Adenine phosphoribosyltransferase n=1 Tax=Eeniella nana TaxID=13502 RepID=A0A875S6U0_EENNA|nr:adenine phosphoribosyltransferase [Brettanomyces nanus]QPG74894.1 adenine phosphoribosyltransferase [Brettanomyces nanus]
MTGSSNESLKKIEEISRELKSALHQYPNFPQEGILFEDFLPIFRSPDLFNKMIIAFKLHIDEKFKGKTIDYVVGLESRGFLFGPTLALALDAGFVPIRKKGKLPGKTFKANFSKEYGEDYFEIQKEAIPDGSNVLVVDDILATGGSAEAAGRLVLACDANLMGFLFVMELDFLNGRDKLQASSFTLLRGQPESLKEGKEQ